MMNDLKACRICLKTSCRLFRIRALGLGDTFTRLSDAPVEAPGLPRAVCGVCAVRLRQSRQLAARAWGAHRLLQNVYETKHKITLDDVREINSAGSPLPTRGLATTHFTPNHCDLHIKEVIKSEPFDDNDVHESEMADGDDMESTDNEDEKKQKSPNTMNKIEFDDTLKVEIEMVTSAERDVKKRIKKGKLTKKLLKNKTIITNTKALNEHYKVQKLSFEEQKLELEKVKLKANYIKSQYKCETCYKGFKEEANYTAHLVKHTESAGPEECPVCHVRFHSRRDGRNHVAKHTTMFSCRSCPYHTQIRKNAIEHIEWHRGMVYQCDLCADAVFEFATSLDRHRRKFHPSQKSCPLCGAGCTSERTLRLHYNWKHVGHAVTEPLPEDGPRCCQCEQTFASNAALAKHQRLQHSESTYKIRDDGDAEDMLICDVCGEVFSAPHSLRGHLWTEHGRGPPATAAPRRRRRGTPPPRPAGPRGPRKKVQCHVCGKVFHCAATLRYHVEEHEGSVTHACPECGKAFKNRACMRLHWNSHSARYACPVCQRVFNVASNRDRHHQSVHATARDVPCGYCDKAFTTRRLRRQHELHVHMQKEWPKRARRKRLHNPDRNKTQCPDTPSPEG